MKIRFIGFFLAVLTVILCILPIFGSESKNAATENKFTIGALAVDYGFQMPENGARSAVLIDGSSKSVLFEKNSHEICGMASTTKIMTALTAIENSDPEEEFRIPKEAVGIEGSSVYLKENEPLTMRELLYCLMLESGNDSAVAIAVCCAGSVENFVSLMNERAKEIGLKNTNFKNPHGLSDNEHKTTAYDLALITAAAFEYPLFREIVSTKTKSVRFDGIENGRRLVNHNKLLFGYDGAIGVKTGYTMADGKCLVSAAEKDGLLLVAVTLHDNSPTANHRKMLDEGFRQFCRTEIVKANELNFQIPIENGESDFLTVFNPKDISVCLPKGVDFDFEIIIPDSLSAPVEENEIIGKVICRSQGSEVYIISLESEQTINEKKKSLFTKLFGEKK